MDIILGIKSLDPNDYESKIPILMFRIYRSMDICWNKDKVIPLNLFADKEKAIEVLKDWMCRGGIYYSIFSTDMERLILHRNEVSEKIINDKIAEKKAEQEEQIQCSQN